jgi:uncharacterized protein YndB with AHSA1/START domain
MENIVTAEASRVVNASRATVWRAETEPQCFEQWFGAKPGSVRTDPRTGGSWSAVVTPGGQEIALAGRYVEVVDQRRLVMTVPNGAAEVEVTVEFTDLGGGRTRVTSSCPTPAELRQVVEETAGSILDAVAAIAEAL